MANTLTTALDVGVRNTQPVYALPQSSYVSHAVLVANVAQNIAIPTGANWVVLRADANFYVNVSGTAAVPGATVNDGTASLLNPGSINLGQFALGLQEGNPTNLTNISLISPVAANVNLSFYK